MSVVAEPVAGGVRCLKRNLVPAARCTALPAALGEALYVSRRMYAGWGARGKGSERAVIGYGSWHSATAERRSTLFGGAAAREKH